MARPHQGHWTRRRLPRLHRPRHLRHVHQGCLRCTRGHLQRHKKHLAKLRKHLAKHGTVAGFAEAEAIDPQEMLEQKCDILAPCAMERAILKDNAAKLRCKVLAEGAKRDRALDELTTSDRWKNDWHVEAP
ncbi:MAG: hypothetical protein ACO3SO_00490, partial [Luteolibacter sp.]